MGMENGLEVILSTSGLNLLGYYHKTARAWVAYNKIPILTVLVWKSKIQESVDSVSGEN